MYEDSPYMSYEYLYTFLQLIVTCSGDTFLIPFTRTNYVARSSAIRTMSHVNLLNFDVEILIIMYLTIM